MNNQSGKFENSSQEKIQIGNQRAEHDIWEGLPHQRVEIFELAQMEVLAGAHSFEV